MLDSLARALAALPTRQREAVVLRHYLDLSERDTAEVMGVSAGAVKSYCSRGLTALAPLLKEDNDAH
jgi:RNA polymerase sigma factor (sigma-70 family)